MNLRIASGEVSEIVFQYDSSLSVEKWVENKRAWTPSTSSQTTSFLHFVIFVRRSDAGTNISHFALSTITLFSIRVFLFYSRQGHLYIPPERGRIRIPENSVEGWNEKRKEGRKNKKEGKKEEKEVNVQSRWISLQVLVYIYIWWRGWFELICIGGWINKTREGKVVACLLLLAGQTISTHLHRRAFGSNSLTSIEPTPCASHEGRNLTSLIPFYMPRRK